MGTEGFHAPPLDAIHYDQVVRDRAWRIEDAAQNRE